MAKPHKALFYRDFDNDHVPEILDEIYLKRIYQPFLHSRLDKLIVIDVGANQGLFVNYIYPYAKQVYAVEPSKDHQETIKKLVEFNKISNVTLCPYAISGKTETLKFYHNTNTTAHSLEMPTADFEEVEAIDFDEFMKRNKLERIDLLKLDPEGSEAKILASEGFRKWSGKVRVIVGEWHQWCNMSQAQFANLLEELGYDFRWLAGTQASCYTAIRL